MAGKASVATAGGEFMVQFVSTVIFIAYNQIAESFT